MNKAEKFWDRMSDRFDTRSRKMDQTELRTLELCRKHLNSGDMVLDFGCAAGTMAFEIADHVKKIHGIDISAKMIAAAKRRAIDRNIENTEFTKSTIFDQRLKKESFDAILALNILHFFEDTQTVMKRINNIVKPGGLIISVTPCLGEKKSVKNIFLFFLLLLQTKIGMFPYIRFLKISEFKDSIANADFQIVNTERLQSTWEQYFIVAKKK